MTGKGWGDTAALEAYRERMDAQPAVARCAFCPDWSFAGTAKECREQAERHRQKVHPKVRPVRRKRNPSNPHLISKDDAALEAGQANAAQVAAMHRRRARAP